VERVCVEPSNTCKSVRFFLILISFFDHLIILFNQDMANTDCPSTSSVASILLDLCASSDTLSVPNIEVDEPVSDSSDSAQVSPIFFECCTDHHLSSSLQPNHDTKLLFFDCSVC
jgi:hypothetical protein